MPNERRILAYKLCVVGSGMYTGVMLAIGLGLGRYWWSLSPGEFEAWFTPNFWFLLPTVSVTLPVALFAGIAALRLQRSAASKQRWRRVVGLLVVTIVVTLAWHLPANIRIWSGELTDAELRSALTGWLWMHTLRVGPALVATWIAAGALLDSADDFPASSGTVLGSNASRTPP